MESQLIEQKNPWVQVRSGTRFYPLSPTQDMILIQDIAHALSMKCRFNGHCNEFVSVAEHSVMVFDVLVQEHKISDPVILLQGLLHDAAEAYLCDVPKPIKHALTGFQGLENSILDVVMAKFGVPTEGGKLPDVVHAADLRSGIYEFSQNMLDTNREDLGFDLVDLFETEPHGRLKYWAPSTARNRFLGVFKALMIQSREV